MGVVIFILVVLLLWFYNSNADAKQEIKKLKNKIENFKVLIEETSRNTKLTSKKFTYNNSVILSRSFGSGALQYIEIMTTIENIYVKIHLKNSNGQTFKKEFTYTIPINENKTADSITAEFEFFVKKTLEDNPKFYGTSEL